MLRIVVLDVTPVSPSTSGDKIALGSVRGLGFRGGLIFPVQQMPSSAGEDEPGSRVYNLVVLC